MHHSDSLPLYSPRLVLSKSSYTVLPRRVRCLGCIPQQSRYTAELKADTNAKALFVRSSQEEGRSEDGEIQSRDSCLLVSLHCHVTRYRLVGHTTNHQLSITKGGGSRRSRSFMRHSGWMAQIPSIYNHISWFWVLRGRRRGGAAANMQLQS